MIDTFRSRTARVWLAALYALAVVLVGFAHRTPAAVADPAVVSAAYALPGGITPDLCTAAPDGGLDHAATRSCDACRIADAPGLEAQPPVPLLQPAGGRSVAAVLADSIVVAACLYRPRSRGPPSAAVAI